MDTLAPMTDLLLLSDIEEIVDNLGDDAQRFSGKRMLLTGAGGFLGRYYTAVLSHLNEKVLKEPCDVIALDNMITADKRKDVEPEGVGIRFVRHDVIEPFDIDDKIDFILHAAGIASPFYYRAYPLETLEGRDQAARGICSNSRASTIRGSCS